MSALQILLTNAGYTAFTQAQLDDDINLAIAEVGFTNAVFVMSPTLTALPAEFKRVPVLSGEAVGTDTIHMTMADHSADTYEMRGFGLFLADGTLFAVWGQQEAIVQKASVSSMLIALDLKFMPDIVAEIVFGDTNFLYPPATETIKGVAEIATQAEVDDGADDERIVTPKKLFQRLADFMQRKILTSGLATGGGDLTADRTIDVPSASVAEADAGEIATKALTPASLVNILANIASKAAKGITITGGGLATGGGDLTANRIITVPKASGADVRAGTDDTKAITPAALGSAPQSLAAIGYKIFPPGPDGERLVHVWGSMSVAPQTAVTATLAYALPTQILQVLDAHDGDTVDADNVGAKPNGASLSTISLFNGTGVAKTVRYLVIGK